MHILVTNDDGVYAPGLAALADSLRSLGDVTVIAPDRNWSISGHAKTFNRPLRAQSVDLLQGVPCWSLDGSPADCVAFAFLGFLKQDIDMVVSGINPYPNVGSDITYSGTDTAAFEGALFGRKALAFSLDSNGQHTTQDSYSTAAQIARLVAASTLSHDLPERVVLNINVPDRPFSELKGIEITRLGKRVYHDTLVERMDPYNKPYYWFGGDPPSGIPEEGTDIGALDSGKVSVCPLRLDMSAVDLHQNIQSWGIQLNGFQQD
ncbi:MAG: 5'/3'-nucleotidase SurE [Anaerolineales bacterium]|nr:5'/3'-nucleotidase SurE [Anaerolineales bacterium]